MPTYHAPSLSETAKFTDLDNQARQEIAHAVAEAREARAERDRAMKDLRLLQLESQSWKEDTASSKAAVRFAFLSVIIQQPICHLACSSKTNSM